MQYLKSLVAIAMIIVGVLLLSHHGNSLRLMFLGGFLFIGGLDLRYILGWNPQEKQNLAS
jgi:hypothetical protein